MGLRIGVIRGDGGREGANADRMDGFTSPDVSGDNRPCGVIPLSADAEHHVSLQYRGRAEAGGLFADTRRQGCGAAPHRGRGGGGKPRPETFVHAPQDGVHRIAKLVVDLGGGDAQDVDLNSEPRRGAVKIENDASERMLPAERRLVRFAPAQARPQDDLGVAHGPPRGPGAVRDQGASHAVTGGLPPPPRPLRGAVPLPPLCGGDKNL
jgi:hypothetical protein